MASEHEVWPDFFGEDSEYADWLLGKLRFSWEIDQDPLVAWDAFREARLRHMPIPEWVQTYLDKCALAILEEELRPTSKPEVVIYEALGFSKSRGPGTLFSRRRNRSGRMRWAMKVWLLVERGLTPARATSGVSGEEDVDLRRVQRAWAEWKARCERRR